jgi:hypothetical protein
MAEIPEFRRGRIHRLYVNERGCRVELDSHVTDPRTYYWIVHTSFTANGRQYIAHNTYSSVYSLTLAAAINRYPIELRLRDGSDDEVQYIVVAW